MSKQFYVKSCTTSDLQPVSGGVAPIAILKKGDDGHGELRRVFKAAGFNDVEEFFPPDEYFAALNTAVASEEDYGFNRNADAFKRATLLNRHPTFVTNGAVYNNHAHRPQDPKLGFIKAASYHPQLHHVNLVSWIRKNAAGGKFFEQAKQGKLLEFSMSCAEPYDQCSACGNIANKPPEDHCACLVTNKAGWSDKHGCYVYAHNDAPDLVFFDNSIVPVPAERTARAGAYIFGRGHVKAAGYGGDIPIIGSPVTKARALGLDVPVDGEVFSMTPLAAHMRAVIPGEVIKAAARAADLLDRLEKGNCPDSFTKATAPHNNIQDKNFDPVFLKHARAVLPAYFFKKMAQHSLVLPLADMFRYVDPEETGYPVKEASCCVGSVLQDLLGGKFDASLPLELFSGLSGDCGERNDPGWDGDVEKMMTAAVDQFAQRYSVLFPRTATNVFIFKKAGAETPVKKPWQQCGDEAVKMAAAYAFYKLAALRDIARENKMTGVDLDNLAVMILSC